MVLLLVVGPWLLPEFRDPDAGRLDLPSAGLSLAAVLLVIYGLKRIAEDGLGWVPAVSIVLGLALGVLFLRRQRTLADPLIDLRLFRVPAFSASLATYMLACFVAFGAYVFIAQYLQLVLGLSPLQAGLWTVPSMLAFVAGSMLVPPIARRFRPAHVVAGRPALRRRRLRRAHPGGRGLRPRGPSSSGRSSSPWGSSPVIVLATDLVVGSAPVERAGAASAISETSAELGGALGIAILGSIGTAVYRARDGGGCPGRRPARGGGGRAGHAGRRRGGGRAAARPARRRAARPRPRGLHPGAPAHRRHQRRRRLATAS